jgi:hypothetical protein
MAHYKVDRVLLESHSTEDILRILREERDDYTPEALKIFEEVLEARGVHRSGVSPPVPGRHRAVGPDVHSDLTETMVQNPSDAVRVLNDLLAGLLDGTVDPDVAQAATNVVLAILRALEQQFMTEPEDHQ